MPPARARSALAAAVLTVAGCAPIAPLPEPPPTHPASPTAAAVPDPTPSDTLSEVIARNKTTDVPRPPKTDHHP